MKHIIILLAATLLFTLTLNAPARGQGTSVAGSNVPKANIDHAALEKLGWRLGGQAWTFRKLSLLETIDTLSAMGVRYIEMYPGQRLGADGDAKFNHDASEEQIRQVQEKLKSANVTAVNYGVVQLPKDEAQSRKVFEFAKKMGMETIVSEPKEDAFDTIEKLVKEYGIKVAIHNHPKPSHYWNAETVLKVVEGRPKAIGACADLGHWVRSGVSSLESVKQLKGHIVSFHMKDVDPQTKKDVVWGNGGVNVKAVLTELKQQQELDNPVFSIEYETGEGQELVDNVVKSVEYFSQVAAELAKQQ